MKCDELKDYSILDIEAIDDDRFKKEKAPGKWVPESRVYLKSEADKVIAELKEQSHQHYERWFNLNKQYEGWLGKVQRCESAESQLRYNKYKRCLAMARLCEERYKYLTCLENWQMTDKEYQQVIGDYWDRWCKRWLAIAEKFKHKNEVKNA